MNLPVIIVGGGGHARVLFDVLKLYDVKVLGYTDTNANNQTLAKLGVPYLGDDRAIDEYSQQQVLLVNGLGSISSTDGRKTIYNSLKDKGYSFAAVIHPSAIISADAELSEGVQAMAGSIVQAGCYLGVNVLINTKASVDHNCYIGSHTHIAPGATLSGGIEVGDGVHIGCGATVIQQIRIHTRSVVGAGALVIRDVPEDRTVIGVPAKEVNR